MKSTFNGAAFKALIAEKGIRLTFIANTMGISLNSISSWCNGTHCPPAKFRQVLLIAGYSLDAINELPLTTFYIPKGVVDADTTLTPANFYTSLLMVGYSHDELDKQDFGSAYR